MTTHPPDKKIVNQILERMFPKGFDVDAKLVEDLQTIVASYRESVIEEERERIKQRLWNKDGSFRFLTKEQVVTELGYALSALSQKN